MYKDEEKDPEVQVVTPVPEVMVVERSNAQEFILLACDGLWDMKSNEDVSTIIHEQVY